MHTNATDRQRCEVLAIAIPICMTSILIHKLSQMSQAVTKHLCQSQDSSVITLNGVVQQVQQHVEKKHNLTVYPR